LVTIAIDHPTYKYHKNEKHLLKNITDKPGYTRYFRGKNRDRFHTKGYEWYLCVPFWIIALLYQELFDITTMPHPPDEVLTEISNFAYEKVSKINFQEYERFVNDIVVKLKEYKENQ